VDAFLARCAYFRLAEYAPRDREGYAALRRGVEAHEASVAAAAGAGDTAALRRGRLIYMATPPEVFPLAAAAVAAHLSPGAGGEDGADEPGDVPAASQAAQALRAPRRAGAGDAAGAAALAPPPAAGPAPPQQPPPWVRLIVEKPFGRDGASAAQLEAALRRHFPEEARGTRASRACGSAAPRHG
jgi:hypothetical protein